MSEQLGLCWKCREKWEIEHGVAGLSPDTWSWLHCHHEPKEKAKCWCEERIIRGGYLYEVNAKVVAFYFCPKCGRKLDA